MHGILRPEPPDRFRTSLEYAKTKRSISVRDTMSQKFGIYFSTSTALATSTSSSQGRDDLTNSEMMYKADVGLAQLLQLGSHCPKVKSALLQRWAILCLESRKSGSECRDRTEVSSPHLCRPRVKPTAVFELGPHCTYSNAAAHRLPPVFF